MPMTRCLGGPTWRCNMLIPAGHSRCQACDVRVKTERRRFHRNLGPCPQTGNCFYCYEPADPYGEKGPFVWAHLGQRFAEGGATVVPAHDYCNRRSSKRRT